MTRVRIPTYLHAVCCVYDLIRVNAHVKRSSFSMVIDHVGVGCRCRCQLPRVTTGIGGGGDDVDVGADV